MLAEPPPFRNAHLGSHTEAGIEEYGLFLDSVPQLSAHHLSDCVLARAVRSAIVDNTLRWGHRIQFKQDRSLMDYIFMLTDIKLIGSFV